MYFDPLTTTAITAKQGKFRQTPRFDHLEDVSRNTANFVRDGISSSRDYDTFGTENDKSDQKLERERC